MIWVFVAAAAVALWLILLAALAFATRDPAITAAPATAELGPESPAIVDLVTGGWRLCEEAAAATLLDLAAKGVVRIEEIGPELSLVRLGRADVPLTPYERMVLDHVRSLATPDGVVATGALAEGARNLGRWWRSFRRKVIAEARRQGLSRARWNRAQAALLTVAAGPPAAVAGFAAHLLAGEGEDPGPGVGIVVFGALLALMGRLNGERGTARGAQVAGRWLGVRAHLAGNERFAEQPAAAVTIWGRHLAYAAALGLAPRAVTGLPISTPADDNRAWSDYGGMWHRVHVTYPRRLLRGLPPATAVLRGLAAGAVIGFWVWVGGVVAAAFDVWPDSLRTPTALLAGGAVAALPIAYAVMDLTSPVETQGRIVRLRRRRAGGDSRNPKYAYWVAIDDGRHRDVTALGIAEAAFEPLREGDIVVARAGRRLGWVTGIEIVRRARPSGGTYDDTAEPRIDAPASLGEVRPFGRTRRARRGGDT